MLVYREGSSSLFVYSFSFFFTERLVHQVIIRYWRSLSPAWPSASPPSLSCPYLALFLPLLALSSSPTAYLGKLPAPSRYITFCRTHYPTYAEPASCPTPSNPSPQTSRTRIQTAVTITTFADVDPLAYVRDLAATITSAPDYTPDPEPTTDSEGPTLAEETARADAAEAELVRQEGDHDPRPRRTPDR